MPETKLTPEEFKAELSHFHGTEAYHKLGIFPGIVFSDGCAYVAKQAGAFWLMDAITSYQPQCSKDPMLQSIQFWTLRKIKDNQFELVCERDTDDVAIRQVIEYSDFPLDEIKIWVESGEVGGRAVMVAMLPSER